MKIGGHEITQNECIRYLGVVLDQGSQTRGLHVVREGFWCGLRCFLAIFKQLTLKLFSSFTGV